RRHLDLGAERRFRERHGHLEREVVALAAEDLVRPDVHRDVEVAGRPAVLARAALALQPDPLTVADARRDADLERLGRRAPTRPPAHGARVVDGETASAAGRARLGHREDAALAAGPHPGAFAVRADPRHGAGPRARPRAGGAGGVTDHADRDSDALDGLAEVD